ncbi:MAG: hypothetical protein LBR64_01480 [Dysgonamonadaceae bacterium]|jgi:hypothetical protein|nr:hypothetical protein [Dysgonamonadaceae bacterium]
MNRLLLSFLGLCLLVSANAQWVNNPSENTRATTDNNIGYQAKTNSDGYTFLYLDKLESPGCTSYCQIIRPDGLLVFPYSGKVLTDAPNSTYTVINENLWIDNDGNAITASSQCRDISTLHSYYYVINKISPEGNLLWDEPLLLNKGNDYNLLTSLRMVTLEDGSYVFAHAIYNADGKAYVSIERVSSDGKFLWSSAKLLYDSEKNYTIPILVNAGNNQFLVFYAKGAGYEYYVNKFDFDGESVWSGEKAVYRGGFTVPAHLCIGAIPDKAGGAFFAWYDDRNASKVEKVYVSHIESNGNQGFVTSGGEEGLRVSLSGMRAFRPKMAYDEASKNLYMVWEEYNGTQSFQRLMIQKINQYGELLWEDTNPAFSAGNTNGYEVGEYLSGYNIEAVNGKILLYYFGGGQVLKAHLLDVTSNPAAPVEVWGARAPLEIANSSSSKGSAIISPLIGGDYFVATWGDLRSSSSAYDAGIFAQRFFLNGTIDGVITSLNKVKPASEVVGVEYFAVTGEKLASKPASGLYLEKSILKNGGFEVKKVLAK